MNLKESEEEYTKGFGGRKEKGEILQLNYTSKIKK